MFWLGIPLVVGLGSLALGCSKEKEEIKKDPTPPIPKKVDSFEKCFPNSHRYRFEIYKEGLGNSYCSRVLFNRNEPGRYAWGAMPWKRKGIGQDFQWEAKFPEVPYSPPHLLKPMVGSYRPRDYALEGTLRPDCSFELYFSSKPEEGYTYPWIDLIFYSPRKDGQTCLLEPDFSNYIAQMRFQSPVCAKFPPHDPQLPFTPESSQLAYGKDCAEDLGGGPHFQMKLILEK